MQEKSKTCLQASTEYQQAGITGAVQFKQLKRHLVHELSILYCISRHISLYKIVACTVLKTFCLSYRFPRVTEEVYLLLNIMLPVSE